MRSRLEAGLSCLTLSGPLWLSKRRLEELAQCEGLLQAALAGEGEGFAHTAQTATGTLMHGAIQLDVAAERGVDVRTVVERAGARLIEQDHSFAPYWSGLDDLDRAERLADAAASLALREMFPPISRAWQPVSEQTLKARVGGGMVVLSGRLDLVLGRRSHLLIDFKSGDARPAQAKRAYSEELAIARALGDLPGRGRCPQCWQHAGDRCGNGNVGRALIEQAASRGLRHGFLGEGCGTR